MSFSQIRNYFFYLFEGVEGALYLMQLKLNVFKNSLRKINDLVSNKIINLNV